LYALHEKVENFCSLPEQASDGWGPICFNVVQSLVSQLYGEPAILFKVHTAVSEGQYFILFKAKTTAKASILSMLMPSIDRLQSVRKADQMQ